MIPTNQFFNNNSSKFNADGNSKYKNIVEGDYISGEDVKKMFENFPNKNDEVQRTGQTVVGNYGGYNFPRMAGGLQTSGSGAGSVGVGGTAVSVGGGTIKDNTNKLKSKIKDTFSNPFAQGFKKYVVTADFSGYTFGGSSTSAVGIRQYKKGMNVFAKENIVDGEPKLVSYSGYVLDSTKVAEKNKNIYEKIQNFFNVKKGFA